MCTVQYIVHNKSVRKVDGCLRHSVQYAHLYKWIYLMLQRQQTASRTYYVTLAASN
jgi:hypothetical protein